MAISTEMKGRWLNHLLPLPHEVQMETAVSIPTHAIAVRVADGAEPIVVEAANDLRRILGHHEEPPLAADARFEILLATCDMLNQFEGVVFEAELLKELPNNSQAYAIFPQDQNRLILTGLTGRGVRYAACTLLQLLSANAITAEVIIPLVTIRDWPDIAERGLWNIPDAHEWIPWMSEVKLNFSLIKEPIVHDLPASVLMHGDLTEKARMRAFQPIVRDQPNSVLINTELMEKARLWAFDYTPYIMHLNFLHERGLYQAYPELAGKGDGALSGRYFGHKAGSQHRAPNAAHPKLAEILAEWMESIADQGGREISCWLTERPAQCGREECLADGQFVLEARAFITAWTKARLTYPDLRIRLFLSTTTLEGDHRILAEAPPEVKIERACATTMEEVLHVPRNLFANPLYDTYAKEGRWIASYDVPIGANGKVDTPEFKVPERSAHRIRDYVHQMHRRHYSGVYGMIAWTKLAREINGFNIEALAEWSWNVNGRTEEEFAEAWSTRQRHSEPKQLARWAGLVGPIEFDVYASDFPVCYSQGKAVAMVTNKQRPRLGEGMFRYYEREEDFAAKRAVCAEALAIADTFEDPDFAHETRVVDTYVGLAHSIYRIALLVASADLDDAGTQPQLLEHLQHLENAGRKNTDALRAWRTSLGPEPWHQRAHDAILSTDRTVEGISQSIRGCYIY